MIISASAYFPVSYSMLSADALKRWLGFTYDLGEITEVSYHSRGLNDTYMVRSEAGTHVLRVYRQRWRSPSDVAYELEALLCLNERGVPVSRPVPSRTGSLTKAILAPEGDRLVVLFTFAPGSEVSATEEDSARYGRAVAVIHQATENFASRHERFRLDLQHLIDEPMAAIRSRHASRSDDLSEVEDLARELKGKIEAYLKTGIEVGFCHGDLHGANAHFNGETMTFFDFDCCGFGWRSYDIAVFRWWRCGGENGEALWSAFCKGYRSVRDISKADWEAIPTFVVIRALWHRGLHEANAADWGIGWINNQRWGQFLTNLRILRQGI